MALVGVAPGYGSILLCVVASGIEVAAFHPESARFVNHVSGNERARGMSIFSVGGNAGTALGAVVATPPVLVFGLPGTLSLAVPASLVAAVPLRELPRMRGFEPEASEDGPGEAGTAAERWGQFAGMIGVVAIRSFVYLGLSAFVAAYYGRVLGTSPALGNAALAAMPPHPDPATRDTAIGSNVTGRVRESDSTGATDLADTPGIRLASDGHVD